MTTSAMQRGSSLADALKKEFASPKADLKKCGEYLAQLKILLTELSFLLPGEQPPRPEELILAREVLEIGALWSIRTENIPSFERYMSQWKTYYNDYRDLPVSQRTHTLVGLNLLRLLAQNRISEFHTELELIEPDQHSNIFISHPIKIEQYLMEGSYNKVWNLRGNAPAQEYLFFINILMQTIRDEIASCSEKAYTSLPLADAATLLYFKSPEEVFAFAQERGWNVNPQERKVYFGETDADNTEIPAGKMIQQVLGYAKELERIV
ncbi:26S proteasome non-ATPase regulatory subunit 8 [Borealophlyctis nickersoniae]|nr:26S proteasome non-ATPase regulatory subunit 8 [Borealophlyctis nickersoniae]